MAILLGNRASRKFAKRSAGRSSLSCDIFATSGAVTIAAEVVWIKLIVHAPGDDPTLIDRVAA
jgi:hypothetical protein